jgi:hypothetical protein
MNPGDYVATICQLVGIGVTTLLVLGALGFRPLQVWLDQRRIDRSRTGSLGHVGSPNAGKATSHARTAKPH